MTVRRLSHIRWRPGGPRISCQFVWFDPTEHEAWGRASAIAAMDGQLPAETRAARARLPPVPSLVLVIEPDESKPKPFFNLTPRDENLELGYLVCLLGLPVEVEPPPLHNRPWATWILAVLVTVVSLAAAKNMPSALAWAFVPAEKWRHGGLTLVTSFFLPRRPLAHRRQHVFPGCPGRQRRGPAGLAPVSGPLARGHRDRQPVPRGHRSVVAHPRRRLQRRDRRGHPLLRTAVSGGPIATVPPLGLLFWWARYFPGGLSSPRALVRMR